MPAAPFPTHIVFLGLMGAGKTSVGRVVAERTGHPLVDSDEDVEQRMGMDAAAVKESLGEDALHELEAASLLDALARPAAQVVAAAASVVDRGDCIDALRASFNVWLRAPTDVLSERFDQQSHRPHYGRSVPEFLARQAQLREARFAEVADLHLEVAEKSVSELADDVLRALGGVPIPQPGDST